MEKEKIVRKPWSIKKVSLFKKRKKPLIRPAVQNKSKEKFQRFLLNNSILIIIIFILSISLYIFRNVVLPKMNDQNKELIIPQATNYLTDEKIKEIISRSSLQATSINFSTSSAVVTFNVDSTKVILSTRKDVNKQLEIIKRIEDEFKATGKRAIYIDLRFSKPIVSQQ